MELLAGCELGWALSLGRCGGSLCREAGAREGISDVLYKRAWLAEKGDNKGQREGATGARSEGDPGREARMKRMSLDDYKVVLYRNQPHGSVAEVPAIPGCHALMSTREAALSELIAVFQMIVEEYEERGQTLPADTTEILHA